jgi:hypothetical protein
MMAVRNALKHAQVAVKAERARSLGLRASHAFGRFLRLYRKYDPDQPRDEQGRWTETGGGDDVDATGSVTPIENDARTGDPEIDSITEKLLQRLADVLDLTGSGSGPIYGTRVHTAFAEAVRASGIPNIEVEGTWFEASSVFRYGLEGSIRTDVVLRGYDESSGVRAIWDLKTGNAVLTQSRVTEIRAKIGVGQSVPVIQLSNTRNVRIKSAVGYVERKTVAKSELLILAARALTPAEWQGAIDAQEFIVPLVLDRSRIQPGVTTYRGQLGGDLISFILEPRKLPAVGLEHGSARSVRLAFATPTSGDLKSCAAGGMALWAYGVAAQGVILDPRSGKLIEMGQIPLKQHLDAMLAAAFDLDREYEAKYPFELREHNEPVTAAATLET